jgi:hypothetical protein
VPFDQWHLVQRGRAARFGPEEHPCARAALHPEITHRLLDADAVAGRIEPLERLQRIIARAVGMIGYRTFGVEVEHHGPEHRTILRVEPMRQRAQIAAVPVGIDEEFISIDRKAPMAVAVAHLQPGQPVHAKA